MERTYEPIPVRGRERDSKRKLILERESHESVFEDIHTGLAGMNNRSDQSSLTDRKIVQNRLHSL
jgi:hypothetical protein